MQHTTVLILYSHGHLSRRFSSAISSSQSHQRSLRIRYAKRSTPVLTNNIAASGNTGMLICCPKANCVTLQDSRLIWYVYIQQQVSLKGGATDRRTLAARLRAGEWRLKNVHRSGARAEDSSLTFCTREHFEEFATPFG